GHAPGRLVRLAVAAVLAVEGQQHGPGHVEGGEERRHQEHDEQDRVALVLGDHEQLVLRPESGEWWYAREREGADQERPERDRKAAWQRPRLAPVVRGRG